MTNAVAIRNGVHENGIKTDDIQITLNEKEKELRRVSEEVRMYERLRIFFNSVEINTMLYEKRKEAEKLKEECRELRRKML